MTTLHVLAAIEERIARADPFGRGDVEQVLACPDLVSVGVVGELARQARTGARVTFGRVFETATGDVPAGIDAGEIRLTSDPASVDEAVALVRRACASAGSATVTGFTLTTIVALAEGEIARIATVSQALADAGLAALAEVAVDRAPDEAALVIGIEAVRGGGLAVRRLTVERAPEGADPLVFVERAAALAERVGDIAAFAPLARIDPVDTPSTGYDDVKRVAAARLLCAAIERIQVDWPLYGPKLAQVALTFGAADIDGVGAIADPDLGPQRTPLADIERQIRAAGGAPIERNGLYVARA